MLCRDKQFYRSFFSLYIVLVLHQIITLGVNLADNVMIGSYSEDALAGIAAVNQIQFVFQQIIMGLGDATVLCASQFWGQKNLRDIKRIMTAALWCGGAVALLLFAAAALSPRGMVRLFSDAPEVIEQGAAYLSVVKYSYLFFALSNLLLAALRSVETVRIGFFTALSTLLINCSLNYVLIFGRFGAPEWGARGAAVGTLCARAAELGIVLVYLLFFDKKLAFRRSPPRPVDGAATLLLLRKGWAFVAVSGMFGVSTALQTAVMGHLSKAAIAANSAAMALFQMMKVMAVGAAAASAVMIGKTIGEAESEEACLPKIKVITRTLQVMFLVIGAVMSLGLFLLRVPVLKLYSSLSDTAAVYADRFLLVLCVTGFGTAYQMPTLAGIVRAGGDGAFLLKNDIVSIWLIVLPLSFLAAFVWRWDPVWVVLCLNSDQLFKCAAAAIKCNRFHWLKKLRAIG
ncbi:MAG: MATE family efflux transporter [Clostridia bacterium]|nr:MATE family efflux transporter [Clostridia bacterium]